jgi:hypothetical protein
MMLLAELPDLGRGGRVVYSDKNHVGSDSLEVGRFEHAVNMCDLIISDTVLNFWVEPRRRAHDDDLGISIEHIEDSAGGNLS